MKKEMEWLLPEMLSTTEKLGILIEMESFKCEKWFGEKDLLNQHLIRPKMFHPQNKLFRLSKIQLEE